MNCELPDIQAGFRKDRGTRNQIANICWIIKKRREFQKNIEAQAGIKISGRNINNLRYADDITLMAESEELKSLLIDRKSVV